MPMQHGVSRSCLFLPNRLREPVDAGRRIATGLTDLLGFLIHLLRSLHRLRVSCRVRGKFDPLVVPGHMARKQLANPGPMLHPRALAEMEEQPELEARIRDRQLDAVIPRHLPGIGDLGMLIYIEDAPDRVIGEVLVTLSLGGGFGPLLQILGGGHEDPRGPVFRCDLDPDPRVLTGSCKPLEILGLRSLALTDDEDDRLGISERRPPTRPSVAMTPTARHAGSLLGRRRQLGFQAEFAQERDGSITALEVA